IKERKARPYIKIAEPSKPKGIKIKKAIVYNSIGDRKLLADVFYPAKKSKKGYPAIVMIFGGGWRSGDRSQNIPIAQQLAAKGYVALTIDYRLSLEAPYPAAVEDVKAAIRWLRAYAKHYGVDTTKIAALGMSAGGQLAALVGTTNGIQKFEGTGSFKEHSSSVQAIVNIDGTLAFHHPESAEGTAAAQFLGGTYSEKPEVWEEAAPLNHTDKNTPPILFINSSIPRFHAGRDDMIKILNSYGIYHEQHTLPDTPHPFWFFHPWFDTVVHHTISFLDKVFKKDALK
ncbi:MAG TPA: alpha/beta hydrolase, partial [Chitinophagaceae bacterium]|nr:alpha/beta hydrolase [Chitinophagaceae bacterium]